MNYEQKYKEALNVTERIYNVVKYQSSSDALLITQTIEKAFPELKESEDEKMRKELINAIKFFTAKNSTLYFGSETTREEAIAWLEKQGPIEQDTELRDTWEYIKEWKGKFGRLPKDEDELAACIDYVMKRQKPADKIEPKFKVDDWVIVQDKTLYQIKQVTELSCNHYQYWTTDEHWFGDATEARLWTIKYAKDGDVLSQDSIPFIFKTWNNNCIAYCGITDSGLFKVVEDDFSWCNGINVTPATKEQRDLLFAKMKEAGYEWDAEKKELKKIEQKSWSEEDERIRQCLIKDQEEALDNVRNDKYGHSEIISDLKEMYCERIDWLKSLKPQPNLYDKGYNDSYSAASYNRWKPSEEQMMTLCGLCVLNKESKILKSLYNDLKNLI